MKKIACYCRVSTKKAEQEMSLINQKSFFETFAINNGLDIVEIYMDDGISAKSMKKRDNFNRMIADAKKKRFETILVKDISRFSRNTYDFLGSIRELKQLGIDVKFLNANMTTEDGEMILTILAAVAQEENSGLSKRVKFGKKIGAANGRVPSRVYGYDKIPHDSCGLKINEDEAYIVRRIFALYINGQNSCGNIAKMLNTEGVPTKRGGKYKWSQTVVSGIIKNKLYIGKVCNGKSEVTDYITETRTTFAESEWIVVDRPEFRLVSDEVFQKANAIRESRSNSFNQFEDNGTTKTKRVSNKYPLSNLLHCSNDNYSFRRRDRYYEPSNRNYIYWTCSKRDIGVSVCNNSIKVDEGQMHKLIVGFLLSLFENQTVIRKRFKERVSAELTARYNADFNINKLKAEQKKLSAKKDKLMDLYLDGEFDKDTLKRKIKPIESRLNEIQVSLEVDKNRESIHQDIEKCLSVMFNNIDLHSSNLLDNAFLKSIFEKFVVHPDGKITAIIKVDNENGANIEIPFCEIAEESAVSVPKQTDTI